MEAISTGTTMGPVFTRASGCWLYDEQGARYFDGTAGSGAISLGHQHPGVLEAVHRQVDALVHTGCKLASDARVALAAALVQASPYRDGVALPTVIGTEAVETALKIARAFTGRQRVICFDHGYHGKSTGALAVTWRKEFRAYSPIAPTTLRAHLAAPAGGQGTEADALDDVRRLLADAPAEDRPAAIILEPIQVTEGVFDAGPRFLDALISLAHEYGVLVILDEIYTGLGRCGRRFYSETLREPPDLLLVGKSLGNGFPIAAVVGPAPIMNSLPAGIQTSTYSGHPVSCAAAGAVLRIVEELELWNQAQELEATIGAALRELQAQYSFITEIRHVGGLFAFDLEGSSASTESLASAFGRAALRRRLLLFTGGARGRTVKLVPPVLMDHANLDFLKTTLRDVTADVAELVR
jgi:4-aminobutyrate aminotransferase/(S)-3-amino-2-methylpropionate transaminase